LVLDFVGGGDFIPLVLGSRRTVMYETGKIPFRDPRRPSYQLLSTRLSKMTFSPFCSDSSAGVAAVKLNFAFARPSPDEDETG